MRYCIVESVTYRYFRITKVSREITDVGNNHAGSHMRFLATICSESGVTAQMFIMIMINNT